MELVKELIDVIKEDYNIPKYRCEIIIDTLLSMFSIEEIINKCAFGGVEEGIEFVSKEFPFKHEDNNRSFNIDYLLLNKEKKMLYLVELKTTEKIDLKQLKRYIEIINKIKNNRSAEFLIEDFNKIQNGSTYKNKYKIYKEKYLKEIENKNIFHGIDNAILIYISPKVEKIKSICEENSIKSIMFKDLYNMKFNNKDEDAKWSSIKDIFKFIDNNS